MHSCDIIGYIYDGECYCDDCVSEQDPDYDDFYPIFADSTDLIGACCAGCQSYFEPLSFSWIDKDYAIGKDEKGRYNLRWTTCPKCNGKLGYDKNNSDFADKRLEAFRNQLTCNNCHSATHF